MSRRGIDFSAIPRASRLARYTAWNLLGMTLPMAAALVALPILIRELGDSRFGLLSLVWLFVGYFSIFDFGLGRALTRMTSARLGQGRASEVPALFWTALIAMTAIGIIGSLVIAGGASWLAHRALNIVPELRDEARVAFLLAAASTPVVITTVGLIGALEAHQQFGLLNAIRLPMGLFTFLGPLLVLPFTDRLPAVVAVLLAGRILICLLYFAAALRVNPALRCRPVFDRTLMRPLITSGGWMSVSNLILPLLLQTDRLLLGVRASVVAVAHYTTSSEVVVKLLILPRAWVSTLFPVFSAHYGNQPGQTEALFIRGVKYLMMLMFPVVLPIIAFAPDGLRLWLNPEYALHSAPVMKLLTAAMFVASLAYIPYSFLQGIGKPRLAAIAHLIEFPFFLASAWFLTGRWGIRGMAFACFLRACLDLLLMFGFALRFLPAARAAVRRIAWAGTLALVAAGLAQWPEGMGQRALLCGMVLVAWLATCWTVLLNAGERASLLARRHRRPSA